MMGDDFKGVKYALFPKKIKYKQSKYGSKMTTDEITLQVTKTPGITIADFRADMVEKWQRMTATIGWTLFWKTFIPFGTEGYIGDDVMTNIIQQQTNLLLSIKQRIVLNLNDIDFPVGIFTGSAEDMDAATVTLRDIFNQYKDDEGFQLFDAIEKTNKGGT
jgi:hypothetical protein